MMKADNQLFLWCSWQDDFHQVFFKDIFLLEHEDEGQYDPKAAVTSSINKPSHHEIIKKETHQRQPQMLSWMNVDILPQSENPEKCCKLYLGD